MNYFNATELKFESNSLNIVLMDKEGNNRGGWIELDKLTNKNETEDVLKSILVMLELLKINYGRVELNREYNINL